MSSPQDFVLDISAFAQKAKGNADLVVKKVILDMGRRLVELSPVGDRELWAQNVVTMMNREAFQAFKEARGKRRVTKRTLEKHFPLKGPKGYVGGRFRANWQYAVGSPPDGELYSPHQSSYPSAGAVVASIAAGLAPAASGAAVAGTSALAGKIHYLVNNLPYAQRLEEGWSSQAPSGMVAITTLEFQSRVDEAVASLPT